MSNLIRTLLFLILSQVITSSAIASDGKCSFFERAAQILADIRNEAATVSSRTGLQVGEPFTFKFATGANSSKAKFVGEDAEALYFDVNGTHQKIPWSFIDKKSVQSLQPKSSELASGKVGIKSERSSSPFSSSSSPKSATISDEKAMNLVGDSEFFGRDQAKFMNDVSKLGLQPKQVIQIGNAKYSLSAPFEIGSSGRVAFLAVVESEGRKTIRIFYKSNSQGTFRLLPGTSEGGHYSKGIGETTIEAPSELQAYFLGASKNQTIKSGVSEDFVKRSVARYPDPESEVTAAKRDPDLNIPARPLLKDTPESLYSESGGSHVAPGKIQIANPADAPSFTKASREYKIESAVVGEVKATVYKSVNGNLEYTIFQDGSGRAWVGSVENINAPINGAGLRSSTVDVGDLTMPRFEYKVQIPEGYAGRQGDKTYQDAWPYIREIPLIKEYYRSRGLPVPPVN